MELIKPGLGLIFWMTVSFGMVLLILRKFAWQPILANIRARERTIARSLINARRMEEEMLGLEKLKAEKAAEIEKLAREMMLQANMEADKILDESRKKALDEAAKILDDANGVIESQKKAAMMEIKDQVASLSVEIAEKVLQEEFSDKEKSSRYVHQLLEKVMLN